MDADVDPGERDGLLRLAGAVIREGLADDRFVASDGLDVWCSLAGANPATVREGIRRVLAQSGGRLRLYRARPAIARHATATNDD